MSSQHKAPLAAFVVVSIACIVVVFNAVRSDAFSAFMERQTQALVKSLPMTPEPKHVAPARAAAEPEAAPDAAPAPVRTVSSEESSASPAAHQPKKPHRAGTGTAGTQVVGTASSAPAAASAPVAAAPVIATPVIAAAPVVAAAPSAPTHTGATQPWRGPSAQPLKAPGSGGPAAAPAPSAGTGWTWKHEHEHGGRDQRAPQASSVRPGTVVTGSSPVAGPIPAWSTTRGWTSSGSNESRTSGRNDGRGNGWNSTRGNGWSNGRGNGWSNGRGGRH